MKELSVVLVPVIHAISTMHVFLITQIKKSEQSLDCSKKRKSKAANSF